MLRMIKSRSARSALSVLAILASLTLAGCQEGSSDSKGGLFGMSLGSIGLKSEEEPPTEIKPLKAEELPWHLKTAIAATVLRLRGKDPKAIDAELPVTGSGGIATDKATNLADFNVDNVVIRDYLHPDGDPKLYRVGARVIMQDPTGRRLGVSFVADYEVSDDKVVMKGHQWEYARAETPEVETYIIKTDALKGLDETPARDYATFRAFILTHALQAGDPAAPEELGDYSIVTFVMDKLQEGDKFEVRLSDVKDGVEGFSNDSRYAVYDGGWVTAIVPGKFSLSGKKSFWVKAVYIPKQEKKSFFGDLLNTGQLVGLFNTADLTETEPPS